MLWTSQGEGLSHLLEFHLADGKAILENLLGHGMLHLDPAVDPHPVTRDRAGGLPETQNHAPDPLLVNLKHVKSLCPGRRRPGESEHADHGDTNQHDKAAAKYHPCLLYLVVPPIFNF